MNGASPVVPLTNSSQSCSLTPQRGWLVSSHHSHDWLVRAKLCKCSYGYVIVICSQTPLFMLEFIEKKGPLTSPLVPNFAPVK